MSSLKKYPRQWEEVGSYPYFFRLQVHGGWLVAAEFHDDTTICFVPDPNHEWNLEENPKQDLGNPLK